MTLNDFLSREVGYRLGVIEDIVIDMMHEDNLQIRVDLKFDIQHEIEEILSTLNIKR